MKKEKYGFIYLWFDKKHKRYYIGSHWGYTDDKYICSSTWMKRSYKRRPEDFTRRILSYCNKKSLNEVEHRWLQMIKPEELSNRYYNLKNHRFGHWSTDPNSLLTTGEKISKANKGRKYNLSDEEKSQRSIAIKAAKKIKSDERRAQYNIEEIFDLIRAEKSLDEIKLILGCSLSDIRFLLKESGYSSVRSFLKSEGIQRKKVHSEESKLKMSKSRIGIVFSDEHKVNIGKAGLGRKLTDEHKAKFTMKGRKQTAEHISRRVESFSGFKHSEETKIRIE